jgi:hypothetical protein
LDHEATHIGDIGREGKDQILAIHSIGVKLPEFQQDGQQSDQRDQI